jgi:hypothetical protein
MILCCHHTCWDEFGTDRKYTGCPKKCTHSLTSCNSHAFVPRYQICLDHDGHQFEHRRTRSH